MSGTNPVLSLEVQDQVSPGARAAADALNKVGDAAVTTETKLGKVSATAASLVNRFDPATKAANALERAQRQLADANETLARSVAAGDTTQEQAASTMATLQARVRALSDAHDNNLTPALHRGSLTLGQITPQFIQFASSIQGGINPLVAFTQQGHQLFDQMAVTGTSVSQVAGLIGGAFKTALAAVLSPIGLAVTGAALLGAGIYAVSSAAESAQSRLGNLRQGLQAYGQDAATVVSVSNDLAKSTGLSRSALDDLGKSLSTGIQNFQATGAQLKNLELLTRDFAAATGQDLAGAAGKIRSAFTDPYKFALAEAQSGVRAFTTDLVVNVATLEAQGKIGDAAALVLKTLGTATAGAAEPTTALGKAERDLGAAFNTAGAGGTTFLEKIGSPFITGLTLAIEQVAKLASALNGVEGGALHAGTVVASLFNPTPGSTLTAVGSALATARYGSAGGTPATYTPEQIYAALIKQGVPAADAGTLTAISGAESGYGAHPVSGVNKNGTTDYGVFQVNSGAWPQLNPSSLPNASLDTQAAAAAQVYRTQGFTAWSTYNSGAYQKYAQGTALPSAGPSAADQGATAVAAQIAGGDGYTASLTKQKAAIADLVAYQQQLIASNETNTDKYKVVTEAIEAARQKYEATLPALLAFEKPINDNIALLNAQAAAWSGGAEAAARAAITQQSFTDAQKITATTSANYLTVQQSIADALTAQANAQAHIAAVQQLSQGSDQIAYLNTEVSTLGQDYDTRQKILAALKEKQELEASGKVYSDADKQSLIDQKVALVGVTDQLQLMQSSLQEVGNFGVQVFDQVGSAITNAFISGQGAAINFGSILKSVAGIALQELGKLAIGNVLSNAVGGTNLPTIGSVFSALSGGSTGPTSGGSGSTLGSLQNLYQLGSGANTLSGGWLGNSLGITGQNGLLSSVTGPNGYLSGAYNYLFGAGTGTANAATLAVQPAGFASDAASAGTYGSSSAGLLSSNGTLANFANTPVLGSGTIGTFAGGIGAGYGLGSLAGGYLQGALNKTGPAPQIGAGVGALAGAAIGSVVPVIGTLLGGALGGLIGGAGGGFIGPHPASEFSSIGLSTTPGGLLTTGQPIGQLDQNLGQEAQAAAAQASTLNNLLIQSGITLSSLGGLREIGTNNRPLTPTEALTKTADIGTAFPSFRFNVDDPTGNDVYRQVLGGQVNGKSFASEDQLQSVFTEVDTFIQQTVPSLTAQQSNIGSLATTINGLQAAFNPAIAEGQKLGYGVQQLTDAYNEQVAAAQKAVAVQVANDQTGFQASYLAAKAQVTGSAADQQTASLYAFDNVTAVQDRQQLTQEYQGIFGDAYARTAEYVQSSAALEQSLAEQRLAIQTQFNSQSIQAAGASITTLQSYIQKLQGSSVSPLSATGQYSLAKSQFQAVSGAASAGDYNSITNLPTYADALLSASRAVNGSGIGYANDYNSVLSSVSSVASLGADTLTQAFMAAQMQNQTAAIVTAISSLQSQVASLQTALTQASNAPGRIAA